MRWIIIALCATQWVGCTDDETGGATDAQAQTDQGRADGAVVAEDAQMGGDGAIEVDAGVDPDAAMAQPDAAMADPDAGVVVADDCTAVCEYLDGCNQCFEDESGTCLELEPCAELCREETPPDAAACIAELVMCDDDAFGACFDANIGDDDCANTCRVLEACEECFTDDDGECLSLAECALVCRDVTPPDTAACIAGVSEEACDDIDACFQ